MKIQRSSEDYLEAMGVIRRKAIIFLTEDQYTLIKVL